MMQRYNISEGRFRVAGGSGVILQDNALNVNDNVNENERRRIIVINYNFITNYT